MLKLLESSTCGPTDPWSGSSTCGGHQGFWLSQVGCEGPLIHDHDCPIVESIFLESLAFQFHKDTEILFLPIQFCRTYNFILFQENNLEGTLTHMRFYTVGKSRFHKSVSQSNRRSGLFFGLWMGASQTHGGPQKIVWPTLMAPDGCYRRMWWKDRIPFSK